MALGVFFVVAALASSGATGCNAVWDCHEDPAAECFVGKGTGASASGGGGTGAGGASGAGNGEACLSGEECASGFCVDGVCCGSSCDGKCQGCAEAVTGAPDGTCAGLPVGTGDPAFPECSAGGCGKVQGWCWCEDGIKGADETDIDCGGVCGATCSVGQACAGPTDCQGGLGCVDGRCCSSECSGPCESCAVPGQYGSCAPIAGPDAGFCEGEQQCGWAQVCALANGALCSADFECGSHRCGEAMLCTPCGALSFCAPGFACVEGSCAATGKVYGACHADVECASEHCADGVCCDEPCSGACLACSFAYTGKQSGVCAPIVAGLDPQSECNGPGAAGSCDGQGFCGKN